MKKQHFFVLFLCLALLSACGHNYTPKPKSYPRITFPERAYTSYKPDKCPFEFEYPTYGKVVFDSTFMGQKQSNPCWLNLVLPNFGGTLHITYEDVHSQDQIIKFIEDAHKLTYKHVKKAEAIEPLQIKNPNGVEGLVYEVEGNAASSVQFYVTDMDQHYLRGALYFNVEPNIDSMRPVIDFVKEDMSHIIESFKWK